MTPKRHIVWDWNGTILGDGRALIGSVAAAFSSAGLPVVDARTHQSHFRRPITEFFDRLAGRRLSAAEHRALRSRFDEAYETFSPEITLAAGAEAALRQWRDAGHTQSLLSMCPQDVLLPQVERWGILGYFVLVDGFQGRGPDVKAWHLKEHLVSLGLARLDEIVLIGDTLDDALAAVEVGVDCIVYHSGEDALQDRAHFAELDVLVVDSLTGAVGHALMSGK
jgi:phosphoglycolate phosphatase-like HAD superfamily hydrolase